MTRYKEYKNCDNDSIQLFESQRIRAAWDDDEQEWYFSVVDVVAVLTDQATPRSASTYWAVLKNRLKEEGADQLLTNCKQLKMTATDGKKYAILTDEISKAWSGMTTRQYKNFKGLTKENLRDNMSTLELVLSMLGEAMTTTISQEEKPETFEENRAVAIRDGRVAGVARLEGEREAGKPVITSKNAVDLSKLINDVIAKEEFIE